MEEEKEPSLAASASATSRKAELIRQRFIKWSVELGVHGYPNIFRVKSWILKIMWIVSLLVAVFACGLLIQRSVSEYLEYNVNTRIRTYIEMPMPMPGIKICQQAILSQEGIDYALNYYRNITGMSQLKNLAEAYEIHSTPYTEYLSLLSSISRDVPREKLKVDLNKFLFACALGAKNCTDFPYSYEYQDELVGNCLILNKGNRSSDNSVIPESVHRVNRAGSGDALWSFFYLGNSRKMALNALSAVNGISIGVKIFNQSENLIDYHNEIPVSPGYCTLIRLSKRFKISMPYPYSRCQNLDSFSSDLFDRMKANNVIYTQSVCIELCLHDLIINECSCHTEWLPKLDTKFDRCINSTQIGCAYFTYMANIGFLSTKCLNICPLECERVEYSYELSVYKFPNPTYVFYEMRRKLKLEYPDMTEEDLSYENIKNSMVCLSVSMKSLEYTVIDEKPSKTVVQLVSDVGGNLGLLLGWSLLNLIDMVQIIIDIMLIFLSRSRHRQS